MSKYLFFLTIFILSLALIFVGLSVNSYKKEARNSNTTEIDENYDFGDSESSSPEGQSAKILGETSEKEETEEVTYHPPPAGGPIPTPTPTPSEIPQQSTSQPFWADYQDKESFCRAQAESAKYDPKSQEILREGYDKLISDWNSDVPAGGDVFLRPPTFTEYSRGWPEEVYNTVYRECIKNISQ